MSNFITNSKTTNLKKRLLELIEKSKELKFLVGFFYFSGINELYEYAKIKHIKLIIDEFPKLFLNAKHAEDTQR